MKEGFYFMDDMIYEILDLERQAQKVIADARAQEKDIDSIIGSEVAKIKEALDAKLQHKLDQLSVEDEKAAGEKIAQLEAEKEKTAALMQQQHEQNHEKWVSVMLEKLFDQSNWA